MTATYIVTGGAGFIGSHIAERLLCDSQRVRIIDDLSTGKPAHLNALRALNGDLEIHQVSITDRAALLPLFAGADYVLHHAALPSVTMSAADPARTHEINVTGTLNVLLAARDAGVKRLTYAASCAAYGAADAPLHVETLPAQPLSPYGASKVAGELYCQAFAQIYGLETVILRYFNVYGARQDETSQYAAVIPRFIAALLRGDAPTIYGDGEQTRDFIYVDDIVRANLLALTAPAAVGQVINIGTGQRVSLNELARTLNEVIGTTTAPIYAPPRAGDIRHSCADITRACRLLGFAPQVDLRTGLARSAEWLKRQGYP